MLKTHSEVNLAATHYVIQKRVLLHNLQTQINKPFKNKTKNNLLFDLKDSTCSQISIYFTKGKTKSTLHCFTTIIPEFLYPFFFCFILLFMHSNSAWEDNKHTTSVNYGINIHHLLKGHKSDFCSCLNVRAGTQSSPQTSVKPAVFGRVWPGRIRWAREIRCCCGRDSQPEKHRHSGENNQSTLFDIKWAKRFNW